VDGSPGTEEDGGKLNRSEANTPKITDHKPGKGCFHATQADSASWFHTDSVPNGKKTKGENSSTTMEKTKHARDSSTGKAPTLMRPGNATRVNETKHVIGRKEKRIQWAEEK